LQLRTIGRKEFFGGNVRRFLFHSRRVGFRSRRFDSLFGFHGFVGSTGFEVRFETSFEESAVAILTKFIDFLGLSRSFDWLDEVLFINKFVF
jgi:hypothetical protein